MSKLIDLTGQDFGYWHVIERGLNSPDGKARWLCHCSLCGKTTKLVYASHLRSGRSTSCGCTKMEKMRQSQIKREEGKTYGYLYVQREATKEERPREDAHGVYWVCKCTKCGRDNVIVKGDYLRNGDTKSCGCITSVNESLIAQMLDTLNIKYKQQYRFSDLTPTGRPCDQLMFDFAVFNENTLLYLIEYDGVQHFDKKHAWSEEGYSKTQQNDKLKNDYCFKNHIPLIRIPYDQKYDLNDLKIETTKFLLTQENEKEYYEKRLNK